MTTLEDQLAHELRAAVEASGMPVEDIAHRVHMQPQDIKAYLDGSKPLTLGVVSDISRAIECKPCVELYEKHQMTNVNGGHR